MIFSSLYQPFSLVFHHNSSCSHHWFVPNRSFRPLFSRIRNFYCYNNCFSVVISLYLSESSPSSLFPPPPPPLLPSLRSIQSKYWSHFRPFGKVILTILILQVVSVNIPARSLSMLEGMSHEICFKVKRNNSVSFKSLPHGSSFSILLSFVFHLIYKWSSSVSLTFGLAYLSCLPQISFYF